MALVGVELETLVNERKSCGIYIGKSDYVVNNSEC